MNELEQQISAYLKERGWDKLRPGDLAKSISIESGELLELFQWINPEQDEVLGNEELLDEVKNELADVLIYAIELSINLGFDTQDIIEQKLNYVRKKYPADLVRDGNAGNNPKKDSAYYRLKRQHRQDR